MSINSTLTLAYNQLTAFAGLDDFWGRFDTAFGTNYDRAMALTFQSQWLAGDFNQLPTVEVISSDILGNARGAYASSSNIIYLSDQFVATASQSDVEAVILEEFGHFVDAQVNSVDSPGDEGELFSALVRGVSLSVAELSRIKTEDDTAIIVIDGQSILIEQASLSGSGGVGGTNKTLQLDPLAPGQTKKIVTLTYFYEHYTIPDQFEVRYAGKPIFSTKTLVSGTKSGILTFEQVQGEDFLNIVVTAPQSGTAWDYSVSTEAKEITVQGLLGDVIEINLGKQAGSMKFNPTSAELTALNAKGKLIDEKGNDAIPGNQYDTLYYVPKVSGTILTYDQARQGDLGLGEVAFSVEDQDQKSITVKVNVTDGFSVANGSNPVITTAQAGTLDEYSQEQRLAYLGFPGKNGTPLTINGKNDGDELSWAINLFDAVIEDKSKVVPVQNLSKNAEVFINASNAPQWNEIKVGTIQGVNIKDGNLQTERWATDWAFRTLQNARTAFGQDLTLNGASLKPGGPPGSLHASHGAGRDIDIDTRPREAYDDGRNFFLETRINNVWYVAAPNNQIIVRNTNGTYQAAASTPQNLVNAVRGNQAFNNRQLLSQISNFLVDNTAIGYSSANVQNQIQAFTDTGLVTRVWHNDPRHWSATDGQTGVIRYSSGHNGHVHYDIGIPTATTNSTFNLQSLSVEAFSPEFLLVNPSPLASVSAFNDLSNAIELNQLEGNVNLTGSIGSTNPDVYYRFTLGNPIEEDEVYFFTYRDFSLLLNGLSADIDVELIQDFNEDNIRQDYEVVASSEEIGNSNETIELTDLSPNVYYVRVFQKSGDTNYNLTLTVPPLPVPSDNAGNTPSNAQDLGTLSGNLTRTDFIGEVDPNDYYRFNLTTVSDFSLEVNGLDQGDLIATLGQDTNNDGVIDFDETIAVSDAEGNESEVININGLAVGDYYVWLSPSSGNTNYNLNLSATPSVIPTDKAGSTLATAFNLGTLANSTQNDFVGNVDSIDYYRFTLTNPSGLTLSLSGLSADADLELSQDKNGDSEISSDEIIQVSELTENQDESIDISALSAGNYFVKVSQYEGDTTYDLSLTPKTAIGVDLQVSVTSITTPLILGNNVSYTVTVKNIGASTATGVVLTDNLPLESVLNVSATPSKGLANVLSDAINADIGTLNVNESATVVVSGELIGSGFLSSLIEASSSETDFSPDDNSVVQRFNVAPGAIQPADLELSLTSDKTTANIDDLINFTITLTNKGSGAATSIQVKSLLPQGLTFVSSTPQQGSYDPTTGIWDAANIAKDNQAFINIIAKVTSTQSLSVMAEVIAVTEPDPDSTPNNNNLNEDDQAKVVINNDNNQPNPNNQPPTALILNNVVNELAENSDTKNGIKVADIVISDDGQGTNNLFLTEIDATSFEIRDKGLFFIGTNLDFQTRNQYQVVVNVDDSSVGTNPDASAIFSLNITNEHYTIIENQGVVKLWNETSTYFYTQNGNSPLITLKYLNQPYNNIYPGWNPLAAETINGENQVLWKNITANTIGLWKTDASWNWLSSDVWDLNSPQTLSQEALFEVDANGDGVISSFVPIESVGNTAFVKDLANQLFAQVRTTTPISLQAFGQPISESSFPGWEALAVETINGENQVLWKNIADQSLYIWKTDSNWNWLSSEAKGALSSSQALDQETIFGIDANGDDSVGNPVALNLVGTSSNDTLIGGAKNDILTGLGGKDILTGGAGIDKFGYKTLTDSLLANYDLITDFNATTGNDLFLVTTARAGFTPDLTVATLDATGIGTALTTTNFAANYAAQFTFTSGTTTRTFVAINDAIAGFNASTDSIVEVTGLTGTLAIGNFVTA
jgi:uncharacterized repeat protein (TIGR01451 family)